MATPIGQRPEPQDGDSRLRSLLEGDLHRRIGELERLVELLAASQPRRRTATGR